MLKLDSEGWLMNQRHLPSPNYNQRPPDSQVNLLVIHNISLPAGKFGLAYIDQLFTNTIDVSTNPSFFDLKGLKVSAHFMINRQGLITQYVSTNDRAWHAGQSQFEGKVNCNDFSIGIELEGTDDIPYTEEQYHRLKELTHCIQGHYPDITKARIIGHSDIAPERKTDPGPAFNWQKFFNLLGQS